jgi:predicted nucleotide-binding protein
MDTEAAKRLIDQAIEGANDGHPQNFTLWKRHAEMALRLTVGLDHPTYQAFAKESFTLMAFSGATPDSAFDKAQARGVQRTVAYLQAARSEIEIVGIQAAKSGEPASGIFIVHGRDHGHLHEVARFVRRITGIEPTILHEQASAGDTLIEKLERYARGSTFAIVIATGDDEGRARGVDDAPVVARARQNVILELGWFAGALGRKRTVILYEEGVDLPSDLHGLVYVALDSTGAWKTSLARELRAASILVDTENLV